MKQEIIPEIYDLNDGIKITFPFHYLMEMLFFGGKQNENDTERNNIEKD